MRNRDYAQKLLVTACSAAVMALSSAGAAAQTTYQSGHAATVNDVRSSSSARTTGDARDEARGAAHDVDLSVNVIQRMESDAALTTLLHQAKGVFVVPKYGHAALGIGGRGGVGVLMVNHDGQWSDPAFYNFGGISAGVQAGVEGGSFVMVLNNDKAVSKFTHNNNWSLNAGAGLTVVNWSKKAQGSTNGDITVWSHTKGLFGGLTVGVNDIKYDRDQTSAYYGKTVTASEATSGTLASSKADRLKQVLASATPGAALDTAPTSAAMSPPAAANANSYSSGTSSMSGSTTPSKPNTTNRMSSGTYEGGMK